jgi:nucleotide-binding universal stress UspA family protein
MYKKILVPLDGSKLSDCSLDHVMEMVTGRSGTEIVLISVLEYINYEFTMLSSDKKAHEMALQRQTQEEAARKKFEDYLNLAADKLKQDGISVNKVVIQAKETQGIADILLDYAAKNQVDLIIISTHGRSGISRLAFGSVANRIVHFARCPVLTITPSGCRI